MKIIEALGFIKNCDVAKKRLDIHDKTVDNCPDCECNWMCKEAREEALLHELSRRLHERFSSEELAELGLGIDVKALCIFDILGWLKWEPKGDLQ
jgi:hypothetical protein